MHLHTEPQPLPPGAKEVFKGKFHSVWQWPQTLYDGSVTTFEAITRPDYVFVIGIMPDQRLLLIKDEQPHRPAVITPAGGGVEEGESPEACARREFLEETGYRIGRLTPWFSYRPSIRTFMTCHGFIARDLEQKNATNPDAGERITPLLLTFDEFLALGLNPTVRDWLLRITLLEAQLDPTKREDLRKLLYAQ